MQTAGAAICVLCEAGVARTRYASTGAVSFDGRLGTPDLGQRYVLLAV